MTTMRSKLAALALCASVLVHPTEATSQTMLKDAASTRLLTRDGKLIACVIDYDFVWKGDADSLSSLSGGLYWTTHPLHGLAFMLRATKGIFRASTQSETLSKPHHAFLVGRGKPRLADKIIDCEDKNMFCSGYYGTVSFDLAEDALHGLELRFNEREGGMDMHVTLRLSMRDRETLVGCIEELSKEAKKLILNR